MALPLTGPLILDPGSQANNIRREFGGPTTNITLTDYYRGGGLVPNIAQNNSIPTSGPIDMLDFYGATSASIPTITIGRFNISGSNFRYMWQSQFANNFPPGGFGSITTQNIYGVTVRAIRLNAVNGNVSTANALQIVMNGNLAGNEPFSSVNFPFTGSIGNRTVIPSAFDPGDALSYIVNQGTDTQGTPITTMIWDLTNSSSLTHGLVVGGSIDITFNPV